MKEPEIDFPPAAPFAPCPNALNLAGFVRKSRVNGPGERAVVWVQGCPIRCPDCFNKDTWSFATKEVVPVPELAQSILEIDGICGVTFSGGEPFFQAEALASLGEILQKNSLDIITFTGYTLEYIRQQNQTEWNRLLAVTDLLVEGPFILSLLCDLPLRGSSNQKLSFLSKRLYGHPDLSAEISHSIEIIVDAKGTITLTGFPNLDVLSTMDPNRTKKLD